MSDTKLIRDYDTKLIRDYAKGVRDMARTLLEETDTLGDITTELQSLADTADLIVEMCDD